MKTLLIGINSKYIHPSMGIFQIHANAKSKTTFREFTIKDDDKNIIDYISKEEFDVLGFSVYIWNIEKIKRILLLLKNLKKIIFLGGPEASFRASFFLDNYNVKYIIAKEGENSFNELIEYLNKERKISDVSNLYYKDDTVKYTKTILPDLKDVKHDYSLIKDFENRVCYIEASRGCFFNCSYCLASTEKPVRFFPLEKVKQDILFLLENNAKIIKFLDRSFNINQEYMLEVLKFINEHDNNYSTFQVEVVLDKLSNEAINYIKTMRKGYLRFEVGIQSTNPKTIKAINRVQDFILLKKNLFALKDVVVIHTDLIAGLPFEDYSSFKKSFNDVFLLFSEELQLGFLKELKGTLLSSTKDLYGYLFDSNSPYEVIHNNYITNEQLSQIKSCEYALNKIYNSNAFPRTVSYLFKDLSLNPFDVLLFIGEKFKKHSDYKTFDASRFCSLLYDFLSEIVSDKEMLLYLIKQDYLTKSKVRPKIWWENSISRSQRQRIYLLLINKYQNLTIDLLYRYCHLEKHQNEYFIVNYKDKNIYFIYDYPISRCGFDCSLCPIYSKSCNGCSDENEMTTNCNIRKCNINENTLNCGCCKKYPCSNVDKLSKASRDYLDNINKNLKG